MNDLFVRHVQGTEHGPVFSSPTGLCPARFKSLSTRVAQDPGWDLGELTEKFTHR